MNSFTVLVSTHEAVVVFRIFSRRSTLLSLLVFLPQTTTTTRTPSTSTPKWNPSQKPLPLPVCLVPTLCLVTTLQPMTTTTLVRLKRHYSFIFRTCLVHLHCLHLSQVQCSLPMATLSLATRARLVEVKPNTFSTKLSTTFGLFLC